MMARLKRMDYGVMLLFDKFWRTYDKLPLRTIIEPFFMFQGSWSDRRANMIETIRFRLNHKDVSVTVDAERMLLWVLRTDLGLTGPKYGCGEEQCGACTVLVNNEAVLSCQTPVKEIGGKEVVTIEGLAKNGELHPLQKAFIEHDALQCGFCTSGMILKAHSLLSRNPKPTRDEIIQGMDTNLCRCGSYLRVVQAIEAAAKEMRGGK
jgi:carbon-monoxide dehydrogenase small subunit